MFEFLQGMANNFIFIKKWRYSIQHNDTIHNDTERKS